jgi:hypothetical protein
VDATEAPSWILGAEPDDQVAQLFGYRRASRRGGLCPLVLDQTLVPGQEGARGDDAMLAQRPREESGQGSE